MNRRIFDNTGNPFDWAARWARYSPDKIAVREYESGRTLDYAALHQQAEKLAVHLREHFGLIRGDRIALLAENHLEHFIFFSAAQKAGFILAPFNYRLAPREIDFLLRDSRANLLIYESRFEHLFKGSRHAAGFRLWALEDVQQWLSQIQDEPLPSPVATKIREDDPIFILYTSGTTGFPKGTLYTHKMLFWNSINTSLRLDLTSEDRTVTCLPLFHTGGWNVLSTPFLHHGAYFCLTKKFEPQVILQLLDEERATMLMAVPTMLKMMQDDPAFARAKLDSVRFFIVGGEALPLPVIRTWHDKGVPIRQGYGLTEVGPNITSLHQDDALRKMGSIGTPNFYVQIRIIDDDGQPALTGQPGELLLSGPMTTPGYWKNPGATREALREGWFHTGDVVRQDEEGFLYVVDRKKNMYISGGENVYPTEVEKFLFTHPDVADAAIISVPDPKWGEVGKAFVVRKKGANLDEATLLDYCRGNLAKYKIPRYVVFVPELPKGDTGKIDRKALRAWHEKGVIRKT